MHSRMEEIMNKEVINAKNAPVAVGPYVHAVKAGELLFTSGQLGLDPVTGEMPEGLKEQAHLSLKNLGEVLKEAGLTYSDVVKTTVFLDDMNDFATVNEIYAEYFNGIAPARSCVEVAKLPKGGLVEIEAIAVKSN
jgi:2-iminobutanoate/2-iminopropanoate deaminase